jgi:hypothetical protein
MEKRTRFSAAVMNRFGSMRDRGARVMAPLSSNSSLRNRFANFHANNTGKRDIRDVV